MNPLQNPAGVPLPGSDEDQDELLDNEIVLPQNPQNAGSQSRIFYVFLLFILIVLAFNYDPYRNDKASIEKAEQQVKDKIISPVFEKIEEKAKKNKAVQTQIIEQDNAKPLLETEKNLQTRHQPELQVSEEQTQITQQPSKPSIANKQPIRSQIQQANASYPTSHSNLKQYPISQQEYNSRIYAGEIHYSRIPFQYWQHRILMLKAMGLNALSVYVMWNYHETQRKVFDYTTENKNITMFLDLAVKHKMKVLLRPGPYICGEWDFGGLPARLLGVEKLKIRRNNEEYLKEVQVYFASLAPIIKPYLLANNGPIVMVQIENQLGSYSMDKSYTLALVKMWKQLGIDSQFYIEDQSFDVPKNYFQGAAIGLSGGTHQFDYALLRQNSRIVNNTLIFGGQIYTGWMTHWGQKWGGNPIDKFRAEVTYLFQTDKQFSLYMAYGGTNFGLTAGANAEMHQLSYEPMITSYDYSATITQQGRKTVKADLIVDLMKMYVRPPSIPFPQPISTISFPQIQPKIVASLLQNLGQPDLKEEAELYFFEHPKLQMYNQGIVVYETFINKGSYQMNLLVHDLAIVFLDGEVIDTHIRIFTDTFASQLLCNLTQCRLLILVQAMGHNNYGIQQQLDIKGLIFCEITIPTQGDPIKVKASWNMYKINIDQRLHTLNKTSKDGIKYPAIFKETLNLKEVGDTYIDMQNYRKGYLWVNGRNLGRYWKRGPQFRLYCPGVWLKREGNEIVILQLLSSQEATIKGQHLLYDQKKHLLDDEQ